MDIRAKLKDLKEMYDKGLISAAVYEQQQRVLLASEGAEIIQPENNASMGPALLDPKKNLKSAGRLILAAGSFWSVFGRFIHSPTAKRRTP
jgi:hypothetical protein